MGLYAGVYVDTRIKLDAYFWSSPLKSLAKLSKAENFFNMDLFLAISLSSCMYEWNVNVLGHIAVEVSKGGWDPVSCKILTKLMCQI